MRELTPGIWQIDGFPPNGINCYLVGDLLIDAMTRRDTKRIHKALRGRPVTAHAVTHAHPDHQGASHAVCTEFGIPLMVGAIDADAVEDPRLIAERQPSNPVAQFFVKTFAGPAHPVDRRLAEGDEVGGFTVLDVPGHSIGHVAFWRESDRVLVVGDVLCNMNILTGLPGLQLPKDFVTPDPARNRESARRFAGLRPELVLFGHGKPLRDPARFDAFVSAL